MRSHVAVPTTTPPALNVAVFFNVDSQEATGEKPTRAIGRAAKAGSRGRLRIRFGTKKAGVDRRRVSTCCVAAAGYACMLRVFTCFNGCIVYNIEVYRYLNISAIATWCRMT